MDPELEGGLWKRAGDEGSSGSDGVSVLEREQDGGRNREGPEGSCGIMWDSRTRRAS